MSGLTITKDRINSYIETWKARGYPEDIPDEVPQMIMAERLAPSYKAICLALLRNDNQLQTLGFTAPVSQWYSVIKRKEISQRRSIVIYLK